MIPNASANGKHAARSPREVARKYLHRGFSVIPDRDKRPLIEWKQYQQRLPTESELEAMFPTGDDRQVGVVCGAVSGNLELLDFDDLSDEGGPPADDHFDEFCSIVREQRPDLLERLPMYATRGNGRHVMYRCEESVGGNQKLAEVECGSGEIKAIIETRGEGGQFVAAPAPGYVHMQGPSVLNAPTITAEEREYLLGVCRSLTQVADEAEPPRASKAHDGTRPGDRFNLSDYRWEDIVTGWECVRGSEGGKRHWRRPGKDEGAPSATTGYCKNPAGADMLYVFSTNAYPLRAGKAYTKFSAYTILHHRGDFTAATKAVAAMGYGDPQPRVTMGSTSNTSAANSNKPPAVLSVCKASEVVCKPISWLWHRWLIRGAVSLLDGDPGLGKSTLTVDLAARVSRGRAMPPEGEFAHSADPADVIILSAEDDAATTIVPRLQKADADLDRVHIVQGMRQGDDLSPVVLPTDIDAIAGLADQTGTKLIIVDPFMAYLDGQINAHRDQDVRRAMHRMKMLAEQTGACVLAVRHLNKMQGGMAIYRGGGSIGIIGAVRTGLLVGRDPDANDPDAFVLCRNKGNLGRPPRAIKYRTEDAGDDLSRIAWGEECDLTPDDILAVPTPAARSKQQQCEETIKGILVDGVMLPANDVVAQLKDAGFSKRTIDRARQNLKVKSQRSGFDGSWLLSLPLTPNTPEETPE